MGEQGCFAHSHSRVTQAEEWEKSTNLSVGGWESTTLKEVKKALLSGAHTLPERVRV